MLFLHSSCVFSSCFMLFFIFYSLFWWKQSNMKRACYRKWIYSWLIQNKCHFFKKHFQADRGWIYFLEFFFLFQEKKLFQWGFFYSEGNVCIVEVSGQTRCKRGSMGSWAYTRKGSSHCYWRKSHWVIAVCTQ